MSGLFRGKNPDKSEGLAGKKGVLWWEIHRIAKHHLPRYLLLENVDRLLWFTQGTTGVGTSPSCWPPWMNWGIRLNGVSSTPLNTGSPTTQTRVYFCRTKFRTET